jgi:hypothetical protein
MTTLENEEKMTEEFQPQETQGKTEKPMNNTQLVIPQREPTPTNHNTITNHYRTGYNQHASPLDCTLSIVRRGNNRIISKVYIDRGG